MSTEIRLGVNIDHIATLRNARGGLHPEPLRAALEVIKAGADGITVHLREDRRHIRDADVKALMANIEKPLNFEMAATDEMVAIACELQPNASCLVPENRAELTTEGGLDVLSQQKRLLDIIPVLKDHSIRVSLFIDADPRQVEAAKVVGADIIELHTGRYCDAVLGDENQLAADELTRLESAANLGASLGLEIHGGHGIDFKSVTAIAAIPQMKELNIGHFMVGEALFYGLAETIKKMKQKMMVAHGSCVSQQPEMMK